MKLKIGLPQRDDVKPYIGVHEFQKKRHDLQKDWRPARFIIMYDMTTTSFRSKLQFLRRAVYFTSNRFSFFTIKQNDLGTNQGYR